MESEYKYGDSFECTEDVVKNYWKHGYIMIRNFYSDKEMGNLKKQLTDEDAFKDKIYEQSDGKGTKTRMALWNRPGNDVSSMFSRCQKLTRIVEKILDDEIYHYHSKLLLKEARTGGTFQWHQDFGYWYNFGCLFPNDLLTVFVPIDRCTRSNGCLELIPGSHKCGRLTHETVNRQQVVDQEKLKQIREKFPPIFAVMDPGDALIFNSNVLHTSAKNESDDRRYAFLMCYNTKSNDPVKDPYPHKGYTPLEKVPDSNISECTNYTDLSGKDFFIPKQNV